MRKMQYYSKSLYKLYVRFKNDTTITASTRDTDHSLNRGIDSTTTELSLINLLRYFKCNC